MDRKYDLIADNNALEAAGRLTRLCSEDDLIQLSNKGTYKRALKDLEAAEKITLTAENGGLKVLLDDFSVFLSEDVSQWRCSCPSVTVCRHIITAALAAAENASSVKETPEERSPAEELAARSAPSPEENDNSPKIDLEYLSDVLEYTDQLLKKGIINCGENDIDTLERLSLRGAGTVHRELGKLCRTLSENIRNMNMKSVAFSPQAAAFTAARIYNLAKASKSSPKLLFNGNDYEPKGSAAFFCVGIYPWMTDSGYGGVTAAIYCAEKKQWYICTAALPLIYEEKSLTEKTELILKMKQRHCLWENELSPEVLSGNTFLLYNYSADGNNRISTSSKTMCRLTGQAYISNMGREIFRPVEREYDYFSPHKQDDFFAAEIRNIDIHESPAAASELCFTLSSACCRSYKCVIPLSQLNRFAVNFIRQHSGDKLIGSYMILHRQGRALIPVSVISGTEIKNIYFSGG